MKKLIFVGLLLSGGVLFAKAGRDYYSATLPNGTVWIGPKCEQMPAGAKELKETKEGGSFEVLPIHEESLYERVMRKTRPMETNGANGRLLLSGTKKGIPGNSNASTSNPNNVSFGLFSNLSIDQQVLVEKMMRGYFSDVDDALAFDNERLEFFKTLRGIEFNAEIGFSTYKQGFLELKMAYSAVKTDDQKGGIEHFKSGYKSLNDGAKQVKDSYPELSLQVMPFIEGFLTIMAQIPK